MDALASTSRFEISCILSFETKGSGGVLIKDDIGDSGGDLVSVLWSRVWGSEGLSTLKFPGTRQIGSANCSKFPFPAIHQFASRTPNSGGEEVSDGIPRTTGSCD